MRLHAIIVAIRMMEVHSASIISALNNDEPLGVVTANIVNRCLGSSERWSEVQVIPSHASDTLLEIIQHDSRTAISIVFVDSEENDQFKHSGIDTYFSKKCKPYAVVIAAHSVAQLESVLSFMKEGNQTVWRPESYFLIVLESGCDVAKSNNMLKLIWNHWILNAVILCPSDNTANRSQSEIELYTFNPYSIDHSQHWETIIRETVEVSINRKNFNHTWHIFKQKFSGIRSPEDCANLFFDKTSNLDGYSIPMSFTDPGFLSETMKPNGMTWLKVDSRAVKTLAKLLQFTVVPVVNNDPDNYGQLLENGSYTGVLNDVYNGRSHLVPIMRGVQPFPGIEMTYPHGTTNVCFGSWITGNQPQWTNLVLAKHIWIALGLGLLFSTVVLYLQNKSYGIALALLDGERLIVGTSMIRTSTVIKHRFILGSMFLVVLVFDGAIKGRFISILTVVRSYPNLDTLEQIKEQDVDVYGFDWYKEAITDPQIVARFNNSLKFPECLDSLERKEHNQRVCFAECRMLQFLALKSSDIHVASTPVLSAHATFWTTMHWPMRKRYNLEVQKLVEAGIFDKWQLDIHRELQVNAWKLKRKSEPPYVRSTKLNDLLSAFILLFIGLSVALIVFAWELKGRINLRCVKSQ